MDRRFITKLIVFGALAVFFMLMLIPFIMQTTSLRYLLLVARELSEKHGVKNPVLSIESGDSGRNARIKVMFEIDESTFADKNALHHRMNRVLFLAWRGLENINKDIRAHNEKERKHYMTDPSSSGPRVRATIEADAYTVTAVLPGNRDEETLEYRRSRFTILRRYEEYARDCGTRIGKRYNIEAEVIPRVAFPNGPHGLYVTIRRGEDAGKPDLDGMAEWILRTWGLLPAKARWCEIVDETDGAHVLLGEKPSDAPPHPQIKKGD